MGVVLPRTKFSNMLDSKYFNLTSWSKSWAAMAFKTFFLLVSCTSPPSKSSSNMKYAFSKLKMMSNSHTYITQLWQFVTTLDHTRKFWFYSPLFFVYFLGNIRISYIHFRAHNTSKRQEDLTTTSENMVEMWRYDKETSKSFGKTCFCENVSFLSSIFILYMHLTCFILCIWRVSFYICIWHVSFYIYAFDVFHFIYAFDVFHFIYVFDVFHFIYVFDMFLC